MDSPLTAPPFGAAALVWGKTDQTADPSAPSWLPLWRHLDDTGLVAGRLWDTWLSESVKAELDTAFAGHGRTAAVWLAAVHDVGKASPSFTVKNAALSGCHGLPLNGVRDINEPANKETRHAIVSHLALERWLKDRHGAGRGAAKGLCSVLGAHHGVAPTSEDLQKARTRSAYTGIGAGWDSVHDELIDRAAAWTGAAACIPAWLADPAPQSALVLASGVVILADWIASSIELFPYETQTPAAERLDEGWAKLDLPGRWHLLGDTRPALELFRDRFDLPSGAAPYPFQEAALSAARSLDGPGMLIVEAAMGEGKTEAALAAAEALSAACGLSGVMVALPTQATADAMLRRAETWAAKTGATDITVHLAHGKASLNADIDVLAGRGAGTIGPDSGGDVPEGLIAHRWLQSSRKRGMHAGLVVGTVDQLLFAALRSKHLNFRHLGLAQKAVIIDEAHAYDVYMGQFLDRALHWLGAYGVPVIVLSATLPSDRREQMAEAYRAGAATREPDQGTASDHIPAVAGYPRITVVPANGAPIALTPAASTRTSQVALDHVPDSDEDLISLLSTALAGGGCAAVVRNTVARAQHTAELLRRNLPGTEVLVAHSRFLASDRAARDLHLKTVLGKGARPGTGRPQNLVVVATQVIEQSLDIDFDLMVTDHAPVDLLLQRAGRVHRHDRGHGSQSERPPALRQPRLVIAGMPGPADPAAVTDRVYSHHVLLRSAAALHGRASLNLPGDISPLVETVYSPQPIGPRAWADAMDEAAASHDAKQHAKREWAKKFLLEPADTEPISAPSLVDWAGYGVGDANDSTDAQGRVRDTDPSLEVAALFRNHDGTTSPRTWDPVTGAFAAGRPVGPSGWISRHDLGRAMLRLPAKLPPSKDLINELDTSASAHVPGWKRHLETSRTPLLVFSPDGQRWAAELGDYRLTYDPFYGLDATKQ